MAIDFSCSCGRHFRVNDDKAGSTGTCPNCGQLVQVPAVKSAATLAPAATVAAPAAPPIAPMQPAAPTYPTPRAPALGYPAPKYPAPAYPAAQAAPSPAAEAPAEDDTIPGFSDEYAAAQTTEAAAALNALAASASYVSSHPGGKTGRNPRQRRELHSSALFNTLGIALLLGFMLPLIGPGADGTKAHFINMDMVGEAHAPLAARLFALAPLLASFAVLAAGNMLKGIPRGSVVAAIGIAAFSIPFIDKDVRQVFDLVSSRNESSGVLSAMLMICGWLVLLAGILGLRHRPDYRPLSIIAIVGGVMFLLSLFIPQGDSGTMPIASVFSGPSNSNASSSPFSSRAEPDTLIKPCAIMASLGAIATAITCIVLGSMNGFTRRRARIVFAMATGAFLLFYFTLSLAIKEGLSSVAISSAGSVLVAGMVDALKFTLWLGMLGMLIPAGLSELMLGLAEKQMGAEGHGFAVQMNAPGAVPAPGAVMAAPPIAGFAPPTNYPVPRPPMR